MTLTQQPQWGDRMPEPRPGRTFDPARFRQVLGQYPTGVCVVTGIGVNGKPVGLAVGSFTSVSLDPPLIAFMPDNRSTSWPKIRPYGAFCVNVLSADQETVCRDFASKADDKFKDVSWRPASSGAPVIDGAVAWIDCDLWREDEAGDHAIVLGQVRELALASDALPLLFFRGGYGRFAPLSMASNDDAFSEHLRIVDAARSEMDQIAAALDGQVVAMSVVGDELVILASAGRFDPERAWSIVGTRYPAVAPIGAQVIAWQEPHQVELWLDRVKSQEARELYRLRLEQTRNRGYSVMMEGPQMSKLTHMVAHQHLPRRYEDMSADQRETLATLPLDPLHFSVEQARDVQRIYVPVFGSNGAASIALGLRLARPVENLHQLTHYVEQMQKAAHRVTDALGGHAPVTL